jgi:hypothetical protein
MHTGMRERPLARVSSARSQAAALAQGRSALLILPAPPPKASRDALCQRPHWTHFVSNRSPFKMVGLRVLVAASAAVTMAGCSLGGGRESANDLRFRSPDAILYTRGLSTDPYGQSSPAGFGVVTNIGTKRQRTLAVRSRELGSSGARWIDDHRILVPRKAPPLRRSLIHRFDGRALKRLGSVLVPVLEPRPVWSPDGSGSRASRSSPAPRSSGRSGGATATRAVSLSAVATARACGEWRSAASTTGRRTASCS